jgi:NAD(P)-dependent dehydrogenase (short-subunit alcohol dehydrogenase family)
MDLGLAGKRVLVTGSTAGIGFASARGFAREGAAVIVNGRTEARVQATLEALRRELPQADVQGVAADVSKGEGIETITRAVADLDVLVNNAGIFEPKPFEEIPDADWFRFFETNVMSGVRLSRHYLPGMLARNWGRILFISSESAVQIPVEMIHYGMTKTAQLALSRGLAERTRGTGVTVNSVLPGPTRSEGVGNFVRALAQRGATSEGEVEANFFATARPSSLIGRFADPDEIANLVVYAGSAAASATTGAALRVDGGVVRSIV